MSFILFAITPKEDVEYVVISSTHPILRAENYNFYKIKQACKYKTIYRRNLTIDFNEWVLVSLTKQNHVIYSQTFMHLTNMHQH